MQTKGRAAVRTAVLRGLDAVPTTIEARVDEGPGTGVQVEGEPVATALETARRVERAIEAWGWDRRRLRAVVRTRPAVRTDTRLHDLPIALAILAAAGELDADAVEGLAVVGALDWGPAVEPIAGTLAVAELCRKHGWPLVAPAANRREAAAPGGVRYLPAHELGQVLDALRNGLAPEAAGPIEPAELERRRDLAQITGRETAKRALEIAAAGGHPLLLAGPPAAPTTGLALRLTGILPEMTRDERLTATRIHSIAGVLPPWAGVLAARPLSAPHFSASTAALLGRMDRTAEGLSTERARPGAATLAHCGVLCLDDIDDFCANDVEQLARTAEMKRTDDRHGAMPADFLLVATLTVPPDPQSRNGGATGLDAELHARLDRLPVSRTFQIAARVEGTTLWAAHNRVAGETSAAVAERVRRARDAQAERYGARGALNGNVPPRVLAERAELTRSAEAAAARTGGRSGSEQQTRVIRLARTIADLAGRAEVSPAAVQEAAAQCALLSNAN